VQPLFIMLDFDKGLQAYAMFLHYIASFCIRQVFFIDNLIDIRHQSFVECCIMVKSSSLSEIARIAGVSISTVSRVLNEKPGIGAETRMRVLEIYKDLVTSQSTAGKHPVTRQTRTIGQVLYRRSLTSGYHTSSQNAIGIHEITQRFGYHLLTTFVTDEDMENGLQLPMIMEKKVDGIILIGPQLKASFIRDVAKSCIPVVLIDNRLEEREMDCVLDENEGPVYELTQHLIQKHNHRNIVFLSGPEAWISSRERGAGYNLAMGKPETTVESGSNAMKKAIEAFPEITAVVAVNDTVAMGSIRACREMGYPVPGKIAVVGFGDIEFADLFYPQLTTAHTFAEEMGKKAVSRLIDLIEGDSDREHIHLTLRLPARTIFRASCGCRENP
jgi:DNA-binding LacI/PurR family transcriptional regulator